MCVTPSQGRTKERLFEEEMEVVWEKGGSGLVFYTDASHWHDLEGGNTIMLTVQARHFMMTGSL